MLEDCGCLSGCGPYVLSGPCTPDSYGLEFIESVLRDMGLDVKFTCVEFVGSGPMTPGLRFDVEVNGEPCICHKEVVSA